MKDKTILIDIDGVLTDGKMYIDHTGEKMFKAFHSRDVRAIRELILNGYRVVLVTADDHPSSRHFADKVGAEFVYERDKMKLGPSFIAVGDDAFDIVMLRLSSNAFVPSDCYSRLSDLAEATQLKTKGGSGCIAELVDLLIEHPEKFKA